MKRLVQVNNKQMEILHRGQAGTPVLIFTGMGNSFEEWHEISEALCESGQVVMFHRPGLGASEIGSGTRSTFHAAEEAYRLLHTLEIEEPVVLVGHSYGGLCAQHFAKLFPEKVKALVLVDSTSVDFQKLDALDLPVMDENDSDQDWLKECSRYAEMDEHELKKAITPLLDDNQKRLPQSIQANLVAFQQKPGLYKAMQSETESWYDDALAIKGLGSLGELPLTVLGRDAEHAVQVGVREGMPVEELELLESAWQALITEQAALSNKSSVQFAQGSGHSIHLDRPDAVLAAIRRFL